MCPFSHNCYTEQINVFPLPSWGPHFPPGKGEHVDLFSIAIARLCETGHIGKTQFFRHPVGFGHSAKRGPLSKTGFLFCPSVTKTQTPIEFPMQNNTLSIVCWMPPAEEITIKWKYASFELWILAKIFTLCNPDLQIRVSKYSNREMELRHPGLEYKAKKIFK